MHTGSGGRVDSQGPLIYAGALRRQNLRRSSNFSLSISPARKALLENVMAEVAAPPVAGVAYSTFA